MGNSLATFKMDACFELKPKLQISVSELDVTDCLKSCEKAWLYVIFFSIVAFVIVLTARNPLTSVW